MELQFKDLEEALSGEYINLDDKLVKYIKENLNNSATQVFNALMLTNNINNVMYRGVPCLTREISNPEELMYSQHWNEDVKEHETDDKFLDKEGTFYEMLVFVPKGLGI